MPEEYVVPEDHSAPFDENGGECYSDGPAYYEIISRLGDLYVSYRQRFVMMEADKPPYVPRRNGKYLPLSNRILCGHMNQRFAVCVYAGPYTSKFLCFDVDDGSRDTVGKIIDSLDEIGFNREKVYVSTSGGKGYHVEIFFNGLMYTDKLRVIYDYVCGKNKLDTHKVEFRPTAGQSIKLPLSRHRKTGNVCWYLNRETLEPIETTEYIVQIKQFDVDQANELIKAIRYTPQVRENQNADYDPEMEISDEKHGEICGDRYPNIKQDGERNKLMVQIAVHNRYRGLSPAACKDEIVHWYRKQDQRLIKEGERAVLTDIDQIVRWAYSEKFQLVKRTSEIVFGPDDFRILAAQTIQSRRKIMFYVLLCMKRYGHVTASAQQMSEILGISRSSLQKALDKLMDAKWITSKRNRCVTKPEGVVRLPNTYFLSDGAIGWAKGYFFAELRGLDRDREQLVRSLRFKTDAIRLDEKELDVMGAYGKVMMQAFSRQDLIEIMTRKEFEELEELVYDRV